MKKALCAMVAWFLTPALMVAWLWSAPSFGAEQESLVDRCIRVSGIPDQLEDLTQAILFSIPDDALPQKRSKAEAAAFLKRNVTKAALLAHVRAAVTEGCDAASLERVSAFYDSPAGKKAARGQRAALEPTVLKEIRESRSILADLSPERTMTLRRIVRAGRPEEVNERLLISVIHALVEGYLAEERESVARAENIRRRLKAIEDEIRSGRGKTEEVAMLAAAYAFRSMDDRELEKLAEYEDTEPAQHFGAATARGFERAVYETARALGEYAAKPLATREKKASPGQNNDAPQGTDRTQKE